MVEKQKYFLIMEKQKKKKKKKEKKKEGISDKTIVNFFAEKTDDIKNNLLALFLLTM